MLLTIVLPGSATSKGARQFNPIRPATDTETEDVDNDAVCCFFVLCFDFQSYAGGASE